MHTQVVHWELPHSVNPGVPERDVNYHHTLMEQPWRSGLKPLNVVQPQGPSWTVRCCSPFPALYRSAPALQMLAASAGSASTC